MAGSLFHAKRFEPGPLYEAGDGKDHYEVEIVDGESDHVSHSSWNELLAYCSSLGVPQELWPQFLDCECAIDVPLDDVRRMQGPLREALSRLTPEQIGGNAWLVRIASYLRNGEQVFFTD